MKNHTEVLKAIKNRRSIRRFIIVRDSKTKRDLQQAGFDGLTTERLKKS
ncbi:MAG: hypothetical protein ACUZ8H_12490 [Candidatus Anammoxibacter sp.]